MLSAPSPARVWCAAPIGATRPQLELLPVDDSLKHLRLILAQILFNVRWRVVEDYVSAAEPIIASDSDFDDWVARTVSALDDKGASDNPTDYHPDGGLQLLFEFLTEDELGTIADLAPTATWWASAEAADKGKPDKGRLSSLASCLWHLKRTKEVGIAERAGEYPDVWFWQAAKDLASALGDAAKRF